MSTTTYIITWSAKGSESVSDSFQCADDVYLLDAAEAAGFEWPYSGRSGSDSTSTARLLSGTVDQRDQVFLSDEQVRAGYVLTEVAYPTSDCVVVVGVEGELYG
jgi:ferredoxin